MTALQTFETFAGTVVLNEVDGKRSSATLRSNDRNGAVSGLSALGRRLGRADIQPR